MNPLYMLSAIAIPVGILLPVLATVWARKRVKTSGRRLLLIVAYVAGLALIGAGLLFLAYGHVTSQLVP